MFVKSTVMKKIALFRNSIKYAWPRNTSRKAELITLKRFWRRRLDSKSDGSDQQTDGNAQVRPFDFARKADPSQILNFIQNENAQTIALVLSYLQYEQASAILSSLPQEKQAEVARRVAVMDSTSPEVIAQVERVLEQKLSATVTQDYTSAGGIESIVQILNGVDRGTERTILDSWKSRILSSPKKSRSGCSYSRISSTWTTVRSSVLSAMSRMPIYSLHSRWQAKKYGTSFSATCPSVWPKPSAKRWNTWDRYGRDVEEAQTRIVSTIRRLEEAGEVIIARGGGDDIIV